jgi:hypothetical protein
LPSLVWARSITVQRPNFRPVRSISRMAKPPSIARARAARSSCPVIVPGRKLTLVPRFRGLQL